MGQVLTLRVQISTLGTSSVSPRRDQGGMPICLLAFNTRNWPCLECNAPLILNQQGKGACPQVHIFEDRKEVKDFQSHLSQLKRQSYLVCDEGTGLWTLFLMPSSWTFLENIKMRGNGLSGDWKACLIHLFSRHTHKWSFGLHLVCLWLQWQQRRKQTLTWASVCSHTTQRQFLHLKMSSVTKDIVQSQNSTKSLIQDCATIDVQVASKPL